MLGASMSRGTGSCVPMSRQMGTWMQQGANQRLAKHCAYHLCEGASNDCGASRRGPSIHLERFRQLTQKEVVKKIPGWAFEKSCGKEYSAYLMSKGMELADVEKSEALPVAEHGVEENGDETENSPASFAERSLAARLEKARAKVGRLEKELSRKKVVVSEGKRSPNKKKVAKVGANKAATPTKEKLERKKRKRVESPSSGGVKGEAVVKPKRRKKKKEDKLTRDKRKAVDDLTSSSESGKEVAWSDVEAGEEQGRASYGKAPGPRELPQAGSGLARSSPSVKSKSIRRGVEQGGAGSL